MTERMTSSPLATPFRRLTTLVIGWSAFLIMGSASSALAQYYSNIIGVQRVDVRQGRQIQTSTPFHHETATLAGVFSGQVAAGVIDTAADNILKWDTATGAYRIFYQIDSGKANKPWVEKGGSVADNEPILPGEGFWLVNTQTPVQNKVIYHGDIPTAASVDIQIRPGLQMLSNPYPATISIDDETLSNLKANAKGALVDTQADLIFQWDPDFNAYDIYFILEVNGTRQWIHQPADMTEPLAIAALELEPGQAFWYQRLASEPPFTWTVERPYSLPDPVE